MKKIELSIYKETRIYFKVFDVLIKQEVSNKDVFLKSKKIVPMSYRRARKEEYKVGREIVNVLSSHYHYIVTPPDVIDYIEKLSNDICRDLYYKYNDNNEKYLKEIEKLESRNYLCFPILLLLKLYIKVSNFQKSDNAITDNVDAYLEVKRFSSFYEGGLGQIYSYMIMIFENKFMKLLGKKEQNDGMYYFIAGFRAMRNNDFGSCLYFCEKAKKILFEDCNFIRIIYLNFNIMSCLIKIQNYQGCLDLVEKVIPSCMSLSLHQFELKNAKKFKLIALMGINSYNEVINLFKDNKDFDLTEITCYLYALSIISMEEYEIKYKEEVNLDKLPNNIKNYMIALDNYIHKNDEKYLLELAQENIRDGLIDVLSNDELV